jgi:hypothetical protein
MNYDIFNGDADGICSLIQLRKAEPREAVLVTGVKRDVQLLDRVEANAGDQLVVLDLPMDRNREGLEKALANGANVFYADHHFNGAIPDNVNLTALIDEAPDICTAILINEHLQDKYIEWAIVGAFGDNLREPAHRLGRRAGLSTADQLSLEELGIYLNYNSFGHSLDDLHFHPKTLYKTLYESDDPLSFVHHSRDFSQLSEGYREDMGRSSDLQPLHIDEKTAVFMFPDEAWARRIRGIFTNYLVTSNQARAHALLTQKSSGDYFVRVRAPLRDPQGAAELCMQFPTGGGNAAAAAINDLPGSSLGAFLEAFERAYAD